MPVHVPPEVPQQPLTLELLFQIAAGAEKFSGALHNLASEYNGGAARIIWEECFFQFRHARCELRRRNTEAVVGHLRVFANNYTKAVELAGNAVGTNNDYVRHSKAASDKLNEALRTFN